MVVETGINSSPLTKGILVRAVKLQAIEGRKQEKPTIAMKK